MTRLRVVTWNIHKGRGSDLRVAIERTARLLRECEADVILLQEVFRERDDLGGFDQAEYLADALELPHTAVCWNVPRRRGVYGNTTLSRLPITRQENVDLRWWSRKARSAVYTQVELPGGPVHLVNCHLGLSHTERLHQMRRLLRRTEQLASGEEAVVIAGDTNDWRDALHEQVLIDAGFACSTRAAPGARPEPTFPSWLPVGGLDRVFWRGRLQVATSLHRTPLARVASDHLPVIVDLELPTST